MFLRGIILLLAVFVPLAMEAQVASQRDECDLGALGVCARHVVEDEAGILTSPFRAQAKDLL